MASTKELLVDEEQSGSKIQVWGGPTEIRVEITLPMEMVERVLQAAGAITATNPEAASALGKVAEFVRRRQSAGTH